MPCIFLLNPSVKQNGEGPVSYRGGTNIDLPGPPVPMTENGTSGVSR